MPCWSTSTSTSRSPRTNVSYSFRLIIDGCNGPIRFRERWLRQRASECANPSLDGDDGDDARRNGSTNYNNNNNNNASLFSDASVAYRKESDDDDDDDDDDNVQPKDGAVGIESENDLDDGVILSLLRPETIGEIWPQRQPKAQRSNKGKTKKKNKKKNSSNNNNQESTKLSRETIPDRLDMIPLLRNLLASTSSPPDSDKNHHHHNHNQRQRQQTKLFDSVSVLFDGVSITKRPVIAPGHSEQDQEQDQNHEGFEGRLWDVRSNTRATLLPTTTTTTTSSSSSTTTTTAATEGIRTGTLTIEITGIYDEADNVIVDRVLDCQKRRPNGNPINNHANAILRGENSILAPRLRIQTIRRTDTGAGKNRRLFRPLGLLRPESVACVYDFRFDSEFGSDFEWNANGNSNSNSDSDPDSNGNDEHGPSHLPTKQEHELPSAMFPGLAAEGIRTLRSLTRNCPRGGLWNLDDERSFDSRSPGNDDRDRDPACDPSPIRIVHVVATDDVFLRQRIVREGGFVMTFAQLWLLLVDARAGEEGVHESNRTTVRVSE